MRGENLSVAVDIVCLVGRRDRPTGPGFGRGVRDLEGVVIDMGQYYIPMILKDRADGAAGERVAFAFYSHDFGNGLKLMEHSWRRNDFVGVVAAFLAAQPGRLVWAGDYADPEPGSENNLYEMVGEEEYTRPLVRIGGAPALSCGWDEEGARYSAEEVNVEATVDLDREEELRFFVNIDRGEYIDVAAAPDEGAAGDSTWAGWQIHPLPLLTSEGNGRGGGDYRVMPGAELIGTWARQRIVALTERPATEGLTEIRPGFTERSAAYVRSAS